jgi:hypothetical protein
VTAPRRLSNLFGPDEPGPSQPVGFRQGEIVTFNPVTLSNTVLVGGTVLADLPLLGVGEVTLLVPGAIVGLTTIGDDTKTMYIVGRIVKPNTTEATTAIGLLNSQIFADQVPEQDTCTSTAFADLAHFGPQVSVPVRATGRLLILCTAQIQWLTGFIANVDMGGYVTITMAGANVMTTTTAANRLLPAFNVSEHMAPAGTTVSEAAQVCTTAAAVFDGLNPGSTVVTMKYVNQYAGISVDISRRTLTCIAL